MLFGFGDKALLTDPKNYASPRKRAGAPPTLATALRDRKAYDYVIIGAGTAGSVLASRLSEDPDVSVLVLEAGGDNRGVLETKIPLTFAKLFHGEHDWDYYTTAQENVANRELFWPRGKLIGGSSSMNAMMSHTCDRQDFDEWKNKFGCEGWGYNDVQPYMIKSEKFTPNPNRPAISTEHRGSSGPWQTGYSWLTEIGQEGFLEGCQEIGIPYNGDINTPSGTLGCTRMQTFIDAAGRRSSAATAYLPQAVLNRTNLDIAIKVQVTRILFDTSKSDAPQAIGVELQNAKDSASPLFEVFARREVILCGGAINSPQTLLLSGVGPKEQLQQHGIPVITDNAAVGTNLKDHFCPTGILGKAKPGTTLDYLTNDLAAIPSLLRWIVFGGGPLSSNLAETAAFLRSTAPPQPIPSDPKPKDYGAGGIGPDIEIIGAPIMFVNHGEEIAPPGECVYSCVPIAIRPQSSGTITLRSRNPHEHPLIDPKYWADPDDNDRKVLLVGLRICLQIMRSEAMKEWLVPVEPNDDPDSFWWPYSSSNIDAITDDQLRKWMSRTAFTLYHPVGTARMGPSAKESVVDLECRVHGVKNLRVVDASIFPEQLSGHPTGPIIAIAEKMADVVKGVVSISKDPLKVVPVDSRVPIPATA